MKEGLAPWMVAPVLAVLELDAAHAGQFMLSRPIVIGPALGLALGNGGLGAGIGVLCELFSLGELPVGGHLPVNATVSAGAALLLALGPGGVPPELAFPGGLALGWIHKRLETALRRRRNRLGRVVEERLSRGEKPSLGGLAARELGMQALMTLAVLVLAVMARPLLGQGWPLIPETLRDGLKAGFALSPWLGLAALVVSLRGALG